MNNFEEYTRGTPIPTGTGNGTGTQISRDMYTPRISIECEDGVEHILLQEQASNKNRTSLVTTSSRSSKDSSSLEGHGAGMSDAFTILLHNKKKGESSTIFNTRARSQSDSITLSSSPWHTTTTPPSKHRELPPQPRSFSSSCRRSAPIPALILPSSSTPTKSSSSYSVLSIDTSSLSLVQPSTPLTALSIFEEGSSPGILTPSLIQLRKSFPLPPALHRSYTYSAVEDTTPTIASSSNMMDHEPSVYFKLPGAFASLDSLETVVQEERLPDGDVDESKQEHHELLSPRTPTVPPLSSNVFSSPGSCSSSSYSSPHMQGSSSIKQGGRGQQGTSSNNRPKRTISTSTLNKKKSKASLRSNSSFKRNNNDGYINDWIAHDFGNSSTSSPPAGRYSNTGINASPSRRSVSKDDDRINSNNNNIGGGGRTSRSSWRSRYSTSKRHCEERPETAMSAMSAYTSCTHLTNAETVYEDARDWVGWGSGDEADLEDEVDVDVVDEETTSPAFNVVPIKSITALSASSLSSSNSSISTITALTSSPNNQKRNSSSNSRFRLSFQRRRALSPTESQFRPHSSLSLLSNQSATLGTVVRKGSATPRSSPEDGHYTSIPSALSSGFTMSSSSRTFGNRRVSSSFAAGGGKTHRRHGSSSASASSTSSMDHVTSNSRNNTTGEESGKRTSARMSLRPLMLTPEKTKRGSVKDWSVLPHNYGSAFVEEFDEGDHAQDQHQHRQTDERERSMQILLSGGTGEERGSDRINQEASANPYAEIYEELAKSPDLEDEDKKSEGSLSPWSPLFSAGRENERLVGDSTSTAAGSAANGLKIGQFLEPVVEESFVVDSDRDVSREILRDMSDGHSLAPGNLGEGSTSINSIHVTAISTDTPPLLSAGRQSTESRHRQRRISKPTSLRTHTLVTTDSRDSRTRTSSVASSAVSRPSTTTSISGNTFNSVENATVEYGQRLSWQALNGGTGGAAEKMQFKSPRSAAGSTQEERGFQVQLKKFFQEDEFAPLQPQKSRSGSLPPDSVERSKKGSKGQHAVLTRQRTKSQPSTVPYKLEPSPQDNDEYKEILKELLPLDAGLRKKFKAGANAKGNKKLPATPGGKDGSSDKHFSSLILGALKKRKSTAEIRQAGKNTYLHAEKGGAAPVPTFSIKDKIISAPLQARHICTGALNAVPNRESPFGRRPSSPVKGYVDLPFGFVDSNATDTHAFFPIDFDNLSSTSSSAKEGKETATASTSSAHAVTHSASDRSSPSYRSQTSENTSPSPAFFSSPLSSTSSHSEDGPSTPRAFSPYTTTTNTAPFSNFRSDASEQQYASETYSNGAPVDFWAVSFAEAQAGDGDFVAPHATLVKSGKLAMLSTQEKARRRASKASLRA